MVYSGSSGGEISVDGKRCRVDKITAGLKRRGDILQISIKCKYRHKSDKHSGDIKNAVEELFSEFKSTNMFIPIYKGDRTGLKGVEVSVYE